MVRCGCASDQCSCTIVPGDGIDIQGTGTRSNPYVVTNIAPGTVGGGGGGEGGDGGWEAGDIKVSARTAPSAGWLGPCNSQEVSRSVYSGLFDAIGTTYGAGNGTTTFNLPPGGRIIMGANPTHPVGEQGGAETHTISAAEMPVHAHSIAHDHPQVNTDSTGDHEHTALYNRADGTDIGTYRTGPVSGRANDGGALINAAGIHYHHVDIPPYSGNSGNAGGGTPMSVMQPYVALNIFIKA